jgi:hypothetical protein
VPLIPLYYVREVGAPDAWIGIIATGQSLALLVGYQLWRRVSIAFGGALVLLSTLLGNALYPAALSLAHELILVAVLTAIAAVFSAGVDLALFDELMKRIPRRYGVTFTSIDTTLVNGASILAPLAGATLATVLGIGVALQVATLIGLCAVALFAYDSRSSAGGAPADRGETVTDPARVRAGSSRERHQGSGLHDETGSRQGAQVEQRITIDQEEIRDLPGLDGADLRLDAEEPGRG